MNAVTLRKTGEVDQLKEMLLRLVETRLHELPEEAFKMKGEIRDYFLDELSQK